MRNYDDTILAHISLGGNLGDEEARFAKALESVARTDGVTLGRTSAIYRTEPQGDPDQPWFRNQAAELFCSSSITPRGLLGLLLKVETALGRTRDPLRRFGPRALDLDLLTHGRTTMADPDLVLPHPRMAERAFVLVPLAEIAPGLDLPGLGTVEQCLSRLAYRVEGDAIHQSTRACGG